MSKKKNEKAVYVLPLSDTFPKTHSRKGEPTNFRKLIEEGIKTHTIRGNYAFWAKRIDKVNRGEAVISVRRWTNVAYQPGLNGQPAQEEILRLEKVEYNHVVLFPDYHIIIDGVSDTAEIGVLAQNDGLTQRDFLEWFGFGKIMPKTPLAPFEGIIIHFDGKKYLPNLGLLKYMIGGGFVYMGIRDHVFYEHCVKSLGDCAHLNCTFVSVSKSRCNSCGELIETK